MQDRVPDPFEDLFEMPCSVIVSGAESGDQLPHTDVSTAPDMLPPLDRHPSSCYISTFMALSPQYRINVQAGTALGEATEEKWDGVLLQQREVLVMVSTAGHHGLPSPPGQHMQGALFTQWTPDRRRSGVKPNTTYLDPSTPLELKDCPGRTRPRPTTGQSKAALDATSSARHVAARGVLRALHPRGYP